LGLSDKINALPLLAKAISMEKWLYEERLWRHWPAGVQEKVLLDVSRGNGGGIPSGPRG